MFANDKMAFASGSADFYRGVINVDNCEDAYDLHERYNSLTGIYRAYADGYFSAMGRFQAAYANTLPPDARPMPAASPRGRDTADTSTEKQPAPSKADRRKVSRECITIQVNGGGTSVTWQEQTFILDDLSDSERQQLLTKIAERIVM